MKEDPTDGLISRSEDPLNQEMPFSRLRDFVTPNEQFYVRCHFPIPEIRLADWRLKLEGAVNTPLEWSLEQLRALPHHSLTATVECAGNGRSWLEPKAKGVQWDLGAVGNANWTGVFLRDLLERAGVEAKAMEVILEGADRGEIKEPPRPPGEIHYARSLPLAKAMADVLLAWEMNGEPLTPAHGFPLRALVPGWFGMASVKWLQRIIVSAQPFHGYYQSIDYTYWERRDGLPTLHSLGEMKVKAQIARPEQGEMVPRGSSYRIHGAAWGNDGIARVEVSTDGGATWAQANLLGEAVTNAWRLWEFVWQTPNESRKCTLLARATDAAGRTQPAQRNIDYGTYMIDHVLRVEVEVG